MTDIERIENLDEYHNRLDCWVMDTYMAYKRAGAGKRGALYALMSGAISTAYAAPFVFQDEDARHFNNDIVKECQRRLGA